MKKILLMLLLIAGGKTIAYGQTEQGNMVISGSVGGYISSNETVDYNYPDGIIRKSTSLTLSPSIGYFIQDGLEIGIAPNVYFSKSREFESNQETVYRTRSFGFAPYIRKYFVLSDKLMAHGTGSASANFNTSWTERDPGTNSEKYKSTNLAVYIYPGITYFATEKLGITATIGNLGYKRVLQKRKEEDSKVTDQTFIADFSLNSLTLGINYFLSR